MLGFSAKFFMYSGLRYQIKAINGLMDLALNQSLRKRIIFCRINYVANVITNIIIAKNKIIQQIKTRVSTYHIDRSISKIESLTQLLILLY